MDALEKLRSGYAQPADGAARAKAAGRRVVGYFGDTLPVELIEAAGCVPVRITGYPAPAAEVLDQHLFALLPKGFWQVRQSSLEFLNHSFGRLVDGSYAMLDALVIPNTRKPLLNMLGQLRAAQAADPVIVLPHLFVLDRAATPADSAHAFNRESVRLFRAELAAWAGAPITDDAIAAAIARRRANAALLREVMSWRRRERPGLSGADALAVIGAGMLMGAEDYGALLEDLLAQGPSPRPPGRRVFVGGSPPDNDQLYRAIESTGATVVGEDHEWGERVLEQTDDDAADPMALLERRWDAPGSFRLPLEAMTDTLLRRVRASGAEAVILNVSRGDEMQIWETPSQLRALASAGIPALHLAEQPHILDDDAEVRRRVGDFLQVAKVPA